MSTPDLQTLLTQAAQAEREAVETYMTVKECMAHMRVSRRTVERWIRRGAIEAVRVGRRGHWRVRICRTLSHSNLTR